MKPNRLLFYWLLLGCVMVFIQVVVGGITRLTGSGLSITKWEIVMGTLPPLSEQTWNEAFDAYRGTPQYIQINQDMTMDEFKFIYFWEWVHRFWARWMGFVFLIPFLFFWYKKWLTPALRNKLLFVLLWAAVIASFGWIMVASGLIDKPYVSPVKLSLHLSLAMGLFGYLVWLTTSVAYEFQTPETLQNKARIRLGWITFFAALQIFLGGIFSGTKAGLAYPTWPDMHGEFIPSALLSHSPGLQGFLYYDAGDFYGKTLIQFIHRSNGYLLFVLCGLFWFYHRNALQQLFFRRMIFLLPASVTLQATIGILTLMHCTGQIPVFWGVMHQVGAMLIITTLAILWLPFSKKPSI